jgi:hypothetical protein
MRDGEDYNLSAMHFIDDRIRKLPDKQAPPVIMETRPALRILRNQTNSSVDFALKIRSKGRSARIVPGKSCGVIFGRTRMEGDLSCRHALALSRETLLRSTEQVGQCLP